MWSLTFVDGLIFFALVITPVFLVLLLLSEKTLEERRYRKYVHDLPKIALRGLLLTEFLTISLLHTPAFRTSPTYTILLLLITGFFLYSLRTMQTSVKSFNFVLISAVIFHIILLYEPPFGIIITERTPAIAKLGLEGHWNTGWRLLHPTYDPFPMDVGLWSIVSMITSIPLISKLANWVIYFPFIISYDLVLYSLTTRVARSQMVGVFAIFIFALTPPANIVAHPPQWIGSLLVLISVLALIRAFDGSSPIPSIIVAIVSYVTSIFFHASAAIGVYFPAAALLLGYIMKQVQKDKKRWRKLCDHEIFRKAFWLFAVVTLTRAVYTAGYLESIYPPIKGFILTALGQSSPSEMATLASIWTRVSPISAFAWVIPVAMASALMLYNILRRHCLGEALTSVLYFVGAAFASLGFLIALADVGVKVAMYPAFSFLIPAAGVAGVKILKAPRSLAMVLTLLMLLFVGTAIKDPMLPPRPINWGGDVRAHTDDYVEARFLVNVVPERWLFAPYQIIHSFGYLEATENSLEHQLYYNRFYLAGAGASRIEVNRVIQDKHVRPIVMYIWPKWWHPDIQSHLADKKINVYYDSERYVVFQNATLP